MTKATAEQSRFSADYEFAATHSGVLGQTSASNRSEMHRQLNEWCQNLERYESLLAHPRAIYAVAVEECFGVHRSLFFVQIQEVTVIEEDESTLGVVLTACHLACVAPRLLPNHEAENSQCHICSHGQTLCEARIQRPNKKNISRHSVREWIQDRAKMDERFREQLTASPSATWTQILMELALPETHPLHKIQNVQIFAETAETIGLVLDFDTMDSADVTSTTD